MLSIIIPTLNEENYLPVLLKSIKRQSFASSKGRATGEKDYEIIVADAGSKDKTLEIAKNYGCIIVPGGLPAKGRNNGAKAAKGDLLFFLDADTVLPQNFLKENLQEFNDRKIDIASFCFESYSKNKSFHIMLDFYNKMIITLEKTLPYSAIGILVKKKLFDKINGYNENLKLSEDHDLSRRAVKFGKFGIIRSSNILVSDRRFKQDGWFQTSMKYFLSEMHNFFIGPIKSDIFKYKFNHYKNKK